MDISKKERDEMRLEDVFIPLMVINSWQLIFDSQRFARTAENSFGEISTVFLFIVFFVCSDVIYNLNYRLF